MADGFIVRKGGVTEAGEPIPAPTITLVSKTTDSITFTLRNNSVQERDVTFGLTTPPTTTTITLASQATSGNQTFSNLDDDTTFTIFAQAAGGIIGQLSVTTDVAPAFTAATGGTTLEYDSGGKRFKSHTFTSNGNFVVSIAGNGERNEIDYLIIAGGGSGGTSSTGNIQGGGGGGAGGYRTTFGTSGGNSVSEPKIISAVGTYSITIGAGGAARDTIAVSGLPGVSSQITLPSSFIISSVGGGAGQRMTVPDEQNLDGGSGGGGGGDSTGITRLGGLGTTGQGTNGGGGGSGGAYSGGGGGGAGQQGFKGHQNGSGVGGNGLNNALRTGGDEIRSGGGGGGRYNAAQLGGLGGGGRGAQQSNSTQAGSGLVNTGSGGGGGSWTTFSSGAGGSGIVVIRYEIAPSV